MSTDDLSYRPLAAGLAWLQHAAPERVLIRGELDEHLVEDVESLGGEVRQMPPGHDGGELHDGVYGVLRQGHWEALLVVGEYAEATEATARRRFTDDGPNAHLTAARLTLLSDWDDALPFGGGATIHVDDVVKLLGDDRIGRVRGVTRTPSGYRLEVVIDGRLQTVSEASLQRVDGDPRDPGFWVQGAPGTADEVALTLTWTKLRHPLSNTLYSFKTSKTVFRPYQFLPALKMLNSATGRLLIADEVGLGKTIEAGLVWSELEQRSRLHRTLVVVPSSLALKWKMEMGRRFDRELEIIKPNRLRSLADELLTGSDPELHAIISVESLRVATETLEALQKVRPRFDLIVVDEAHVFRNASTKSNLLGGMLSDWADHLLFLSATPINLRSDDLYNLLTLLDDGLFQDSEVFHLQLEPNAQLNAVARNLALGGKGQDEHHRLEAIADMQLGTSVTQRPGFDRLSALTQLDRPLHHAERSEVKRLVNELNTLSGVVTRTRKVDVPDAKAVREPHQIEVLWSAEEKELYDSILAYYVGRALERDTPLGFATQMPLRQAASCLPAARSTLLRRDPGASLRDADDTEDLGEFGTTDEEDELTVTELPVLGRPLPADSKLESLLAELRHLRAKGIRQALIFSTFRGTIAYLVEELRQDFTVNQLHGGIPMIERQPVIDAFRDGKFDLLVASEVASEGLDFEFCNVIVNYDLPWNPMRVEQRIGRLDRFGQKHEKILILNMHVPGTIESDILERLYTRIGVFENSIGDLEPILRDTFLEEARSLLDPRLTPAQRQRRADEIAVAVENRAADLERLNEERAVLATLDDLAVEGLADSGPVDGRYVGASEIHRMVETFVTNLGGSLEPTSRPGVLTLRGTPPISEALWRRRSTSRSATGAINRLQGGLRQGDPIDVSFDADLASARDVELLSARHPLIDAAVQHLESEGLRLKRYGVASVPNLPPGRVFALQIDLIEHTGIRPARELWAAAIDLALDEPAPDVGGIVLESLAAGTLRTWEGPPPTDVIGVMSRLRDLAWARQSAEEPRRRAENDALAVARLEARKVSMRIKLAKAKSTYDLVTRDSRDARVLRMAEGRIRNLSQDLEQLSVDMAAAQQFSFVTTTIAVMQVIGAGP